MVTTFLSNDATAVVLTPSVAAAVRTAKVKDPLPYLLICAFIANAASFMLPISNPANLVIYHSRMPPLLTWLTRFLLPSFLAIMATFIALRWTQRGVLGEELSGNVALPALSAGAKISACGIIVTAFVLITSSASGIELGLPTAIAGAVTVALVLLLERQGPHSILKGISWDVLPLAAGLFVLVEALQKTGLIHSISSVLQKYAQQEPNGAAWGAGVIVALASNLMNNLPTGLIGGIVVQMANLSPHLTTAILIGVDIGPNLSVTGSLATILWLTALRREGLTAGAWAFLKLGLVVMPPALLLALGGSLL